MFDKHPAEVWAAWPKCPPAVAFMLRTIPALEAERDSLIDVLHRNGFRRCDIAACNCGSWHYQGPYRQRFAEIQEALSDADENLSGRTLLQCVQGVIAERDQLRAEVEALRDANRTFATASILPDDKVIVDKAEVEALRADAERYRWLRSVPNGFKAQQIVNDTPHGMDAAIDAARKAAP